MSKRKDWSQSLWGQQAKLSLLFAAAIVLIFTLLGAKDIWTQEHRWVDIVANMFYRQDFWHPYLGNTNYYDKPLLSYWLIAFFVKVTGQLSAFSARLPSAIAGLLSIAGCYQLGRNLSSRKLGLASAWLLLTTFYFLFWARTSSADMLNVAGCLWAVSWYISHRQQTTFASYSVFFLLLAITSLCKGLIGAVIPLLAVGVDVLINNSWRKHINLRLLMALVPALIIYLAPFVISQLLNGGQYQENGLYLVYRENILRFFQPFDHQGSVWTYFVYLPVYTLPWCFLLVPALLTLPSRFKRMQPNARWIVFYLITLFIFFTLSGSRRSYYILPVVPFAILFIADWLIYSKLMWQRLIAIFVVINYLLLLVIVDVLPGWYYHNYGINAFAKQVTKISHKMTNKQFLLVDADSKLVFYLKLAPSTEIISLAKDQIVSKQTLLAYWPALKHLPKHTIILSRAIYRQQLTQLFPAYRLVQLATPPFAKYIAEPQQAPIALIPPETH